MRYILAIFFFAVAAGCSPSPTRATRCPFDLDEVLTHCGFTNAIPVQPVRWSQVKDARPLVVDRVVLIGSSGTNFVVVSAYRHPQRRSRWDIDEVGLLMMNDMERHVLGKQTYSVYPSQQDVDELLRELDEFNNDPTWETVFEGSSPVRKPT